MDSGCLLTWAGRAALAGVSARVALAIWRILFPHLIAPLFGQSRRLAHHLRPGDWAVVTGATDGIGKAYAQHLALHFQANLLLIGRNPTKLATVKTQIAAAAPRAQIRLFTLDFASADEADYAGLAAQLKSLQIGALINSVGMAYSQYDRIGRVAEGERLAMDLLKVNSLSVTLLCRMVLEGMAARGRGAVVNISSASGVFYTAYISIYSASKVNSVIPS